VCHLSLKRDSAYQPPSFPDNQHIPSLNASDWIALLPYGPEACLALAADGALSLYGYPAGPPAGIAGLLEPSRKPLWSVNVLAEAK